MLRRGIQPIFKQTIHRPGTLERLIPAVNLDPRAAYIVRRIPSTFYRYQHTSSPSNITSRSKVGYMGDNIVNFYSGSPPLNRLSFHRNDTEKMRKHLSAPDARFILFKEGKPLMHLSEDGRPSGLYFLTQEEVEPFLPKEARVFSDPPTPDLSKPFQSARLPSHLPPLIFLGIDDRPNPEHAIEGRTVGKPAEYDARDPRGVGYFALALVEEEGKVEEDKGVKTLSGKNEFVEPRLGGSSLNGWEANIFAEARALVDWNTRNTYCPGCGSKTYSLWCGWKRGCGTIVGEGREAVTTCPSTKGLHNYAYPRTDPVIIMGILSGDGGKMLVGRQKSWPAGMYSCLAGFVEPGESLEDAVRREVMEEAGVKVGEVRYSSCQPWPFPSNLMIGCYGLVAPSKKVKNAEGEEEEQLDLELDNELEDARWVGREGVREILDNPEARNISRNEHKKFEDQGQGQAPKPAGTEESSALAPAENSPTAELAKAPQATQAKALDKSNDKNGLPKGFRIPPKTAIAGMLIERWARGEMDEVRMEQRGGGGEVKGRL